MELVAAGVGFAAIVSSLEFVKVRRLVGPGGLLDWQVLRFRTRVSAVLPMRALSGPHAETGWLVVCLLRATAGAAALPLPGRSDRSVGLALVLVGLLTLLLMYRLMYGLDGSDQLLAVLGLTAGSALLVGTTTAIEGFCWFVALLMGIAYVTSGVTKLGSATWRSGSAIAVVMRTEVYGIPALAGLAASAWGRLATRSVIVVELSFPLVALGYPQVTWTVLAALAAFHLSTAVVMGLNSFLPAFVCTFGCVAWSSAQLW